MCYGRCSFTVYKTFLNNILILVTNSHELLSICGCVFVYNKHHIFNFGSTESLDDQLSRSVLIGLE